MKEKIGCKKQVLLFKAQPWNRQYINNVLKQDYFSKDDHKVKVRKLTYLFGAEPLDESFCWRNTEEGHDFWREQNTNMERLSDFVNKDYKTKSLRTALPDWIL